jgi:hypothetical protein
VNDEGKRIYLISVEQEIQLYKLGCLIALKLLVERGISA